jgi:hypothetical protein
VIIEFARCPRDRIVYVITREFREEEAFVCRSLAKNKLWINYPMGIVLQASQWRGITIS